METASPLRRRAALASLDANAMPHFQTESKPTPNAAATAAKIVADSILAAGKKRGSLGVDGSPVNKKTCLSSSQTGQSEDADEASSPAASSVFDNSEDASWSTTATEVDGPTRTRGVSLTREQARERAEILRLRLGLASYKVRTGQISVPLADLQAKPIPRTFSPASPAVEVSSSPQQTQEQQSTQQSTQQTSTQEDDDVSVVPESSQESNSGPDGEEADTAANSTPQTKDLEEGVVNSSTKGGAVSGLLSLSRGDA